MFLEINEGEHFWQTKEDNKIRDNITLYCKCSYACETNTSKMDIMKKKQWKNSTREHNAFTPVGKKKMERNK